MYKIKNVAKRGTSLIAAASMLAGIGTSALPALVSADALNPLTQRSLLLSSSSPGWASTDGSGNGTYATPNSGTNGLKSGETFSFKVSTNSTTTPPNATGVAVKAFTFQYCTTAAGQCTAPGDDTTHPGGTDDSTHADFNVVTSSPSEVASSGAWATIQARANNPPTQPNQLAGIPLADSSEGNFVVLKNGAYSGGWSMSASNVEDGATTTGKKNYITLVNSTGIQPAHDDTIKVIFFATNTNYLTNPGSGAFFVKINDYDSATTQNFRDNYPTAATPQNVIDGGVTVANIMNQSIQIQTKVLETMDFSVGIIDPDTLLANSAAANGLGATTTHGQCDPILTRMPSTPTAPANALLLGKAAAEDSLETGTAYDTHSYFRLSSNSSGGASVYYAGGTLANTEGDQIQPIGNTAAYSHTGTEQFGLALDNSTSGNRLVTAGISGVDNNPDNATLDTTSTGGQDWASLIAAHTSDVPNYWHNPQLAPLVPATGYDLGAGTIANSSGPKFAFDPDANTVPALIASENTQVVSCVTGKVRYIGNIAATTPAGIYTTKINYLAAPEY